MRIDRTIENYVAQRFPGFGVNKKAQIVRLLYEISKREGCGFESVLPKECPTQFTSLKSFLLAKRFPSAGADRAKALKMNALNLDPELAVPLNRSHLFAPKNLFVEKRVTKSNLFLSLKEQFPSAGIEAIETYKEFCAQRPFTIRDYNDRTQNLFVIKETFDFLHSCPCSKGSVCCGYANLKLGYGCPYECSYCFLQAYTNAPGIVVPANLEDFFNQIELSEKNWRLGSGQFTDSLVFDPWTRFSEKIVRFFEKHPESLFEFKTKSANVDLLCQIPPADNIVVSWSLNPQNLIAAEEFFTASLTERLRSAQRCVEHGYSVGFHFDPIFFYPGWEDDYGGVIDRIFDAVPFKSIRWISLGCLRMTSSQKQIIETRFPNNRILNAELIFDCDQKLRYPHSVRKEIFDFMRNRIQSRSSKVKVYLCMEPEKIHDELGFSKTAF